MCLDKVSHPKPEYLYFYCILIYLVMYLIRVINLNPS